MITAQITELVPSGQPWGQAPNGPNYPFSIAFNNGMRGTCNFRSQTPWCQVGQTISFEQSGDFHGVAKFKLHKNPQGGYQQPPQNSPQNQNQPAPYSAPPPANPNPPASINGQSVGMAINNAIDLVLKLNLAPYQPDFWPMVYEIASDILRLAYKLERAQLAPPRSQRGGQQQVAPAPQPPPQPSARPQPGPGGSAFKNDGPDEDVPF